MPKGKYKKTAEHKSKISSTMKEKNSSFRKPFCYVTKDGKTFREKDLDLFAKKQESKQIKDRFYKSYGTMGLIEPLYSPDLLANLLEINTFHARCCSVKATDTAGLGYELQEIVDNPDDAKRDEIKEFFESQTPPITTILTRMQKDWEAIGYSALELGRVGNLYNGKPAKLYHMPAHTLRIHKDGNKFVQKRSGTKKWFKRINYDKDVSCKDGEEYDLGSLDPDDRANEIIYNTDYSSRSDYYGVTCVAPAIGAIYGDISRRDYNIAFFSNFGIPAFAVFITGDFDPGKEDDDGKTALEKTIEEHFKDISSKPHSTLLLSVPTRRGPAGEVKIDMKPLAVDIKEASFRLYRRDNRDEVIIAHGVPAYRIGVVETGSLGGSTARESTEIYKRSVIEPRQTILEQIINQEIIWHENGFDTKDFSYKFVDLDTTDEEHEKNMMDFFFMNGAITIRGIIQHYANRYGLVDDPDEPLLDVRFVNGQPITGKFANTGEVESIMKSLQNKLIKAALKSGNGSDKKGVERVIDILKNMRKVD